MDEQSEIIDSFYERIDALEQMYEDIAAALGMPLTNPIKQHDEILARAKECKFAHDYFHRKPSMDLW